jgi:hypothetical protein
MEDSKVEGLFTRLVSEGRRKPMLVVNIEISKDGDFSERRMRQDVLHFRGQIVKEIYIVGGVR